MTVPDSTLDHPGLTPLAQQTLRRLMRVWFDFERRLSRVPILKRLDAGTFTIADFRCLLRNLRPQVVEGARWITRCASSFDRDHAHIRSMVIGHAMDEHRDYEMLEHDYVAAGGEYAEIQQAERNIGTEALHAYLMSQATQPNPVDMLGAMFIIEGLGDKMANNWANRIEELTQCGPQATRFIRYHGENDASHMEKFYTMLSDAASSEETATAIVRTAKIVARLYALQLEEVDNV